MLLGMPLQSAAYISVWSKYMTVGYFQLP